MLKLVFWGTPQFAVPALQRLIADARFEVLGVVTQPDKRRGRGAQVLPSAVKRVALEHQLPIWQPTRVKKDSAVLAQLRSLAADAFVVVAYGQILSPEILAMPRLGCINAHGSLLPQYRGAAPIQWSIYDGAFETGVTTMLMDAGMDTGPMLLKQATPIGLLENSPDLAVRLAEISADLLVETLMGLDTNTIQPQAQLAAAASHARLIHKPDFSLDWRRSAIALHNQVRAFTPSAVATFRDQMLKVLQTVPLCPELGDRLPEPYAALLPLEPTNVVQPAPGRVVQVMKGQGPVVQTGDGLLLLTQVQLAGKRVQSGWDFANGLRLQEGEQLENGPAV